MINPHSGPGKAQQIFENSVKSMLDEADIVYKVLITGLYFMVAFSCNHCNRYPTFYYTHTVACFILVIDTTVASIILFIDTTVFFL